MQYGMRDVLGIYICILQRWNDEIFCEFGMILTCGALVGVKYAFHGHHHDRLNYREDYASMGFEAHGVGFCGVTDQYGGMIAIGDSDEAGMSRNQRFQGRRK